MEFISQFHSFFIILYTIFSFLPRSCLSHNIWAPFPFLYNRSCYFYDNLFKGKVLLINQYLMYNSFISSNLIHNSYVNYIKLKASTCFGRHPPILRRSMSLTLRRLMSYIYRCPKKIVPFLFFPLGAQCVESGVSCTDCY